MFANEWISLEQLEQHYFRRRRYMNEHGISDRIMNDFESHDFSITAENAFTFKRTVKYQHLSLDEELWKTTLDKHKEGVLRTIVP